MSGLFSNRHLDPAAVPRLEYCGGPVDGAHIYVDRHGGEWRIVDFAGGDGRAIEECRATRPPSSRVQYRVFLLQPAERYAKLYAFDLWERREFTVYSSWRLDGQWNRATMVRWPDRRRVDPRGVIVRGSCTNRPEKR